MKKSQEKSLFIEHMLEQVHSLPIQDVIGARVPVRKNGRHYECICPFHRASHYGAFKITPDKGIWKCFACGDGFGGDAIKFDSLLKSKKWIDSAFDIALEFNLISKDQYEKYGSKISVQESLAFEKRFTPKKEKIEQTVAPLEIREKVYKAMKIVMPLSDVHRKHLREVREIPEERINADYFSFRTYGRDTLVKRIMLASGVSAEQLINVPGFFFDKKTERVSFAGSKGIGILIHDADGHITAIQIRKDKVNEGDSKYIWFASTFAVMDPDNYAGGASVQSQKDVLLPDPLVPNRSDILCITEGRFKSERIIRNGYSSISVQGVTTWKGIDVPMRAVKNKTKTRKIIIMFDADMMKNKAVFDQTTELTKMIRRNFKDIKDIVYALWPYELGKGIDDLLINGHGDKIIYKQIDEVQKIYDIIYEKVLRHFNVESIRQIPDEKLEIFEKTLLATMECNFFKSILPR